MKGLYSAVRAGRRHEGRRPRPDLLSLVDKVFAGIRPDDPRVNDWLGLFNEANRTRLAFEVEHVLPYIKENTRALDVGCTPPILAGCLHHLGHTITGVDLAPERFSSALRELEVDVKKCDIEREPLPFANASFDLGTFGEVFEHLRIDPIFTLNEIKRVLAPRGTVLLSTPNLRSLRGIAGLLMYGSAYAVCRTDVYTEYEKIATTGFMGHVREYTLREVAGFISRIGFRVTEVIHRGSYRNLPARAISFLFPRLRPFMTLVCEKAD